MALINKSTIRNIVIQALAVAVGTVIAVPLLRSLTSRFNTTG